MDIFTCQYIEVTFKGNQTLPLWNKNYFEWKAAEECQARRSSLSSLYLPKAGHKFLFVKVTWASLVAQLVKNLPAVQETLV